MCENVKVSNLFVCTESPSLHTNTSNLIQHLGGLSSLFSMFRNPFSEWETWLLLFSTYSLTCAVQPIFLSILAASCVCHLLISYLLLPAFLVLGDTAINVFLRHEDFICLLTFLNAEHQCQVEIGSNGHVLLGRECVLFLFNTEHSTRHTIGALWMLYEWVNE